MGGHAHHEFAWATGMGPQRPKNEARIRAWTDQLLRLCADSEEGGLSGGQVRREIHTVVLSSEEFEFVRDVREIGLLAEHFDVRVVVYLRKQDHYLESSYNQQVRMYGQRFPGSIYQFAFSFNPFTRYNFRFLFERWEAVFGRDNIIARPYGTRAIGGDIRADFLRIIGTDQSDLLFSGVEVERDNVSLHASALPYLARINEINLPAPMHRQVIAALRETIPRVANARLLRYEESNRFYQSFEKSNEHVFERYLGAGMDPFGELMRGEGEEHYVDHDEVDVDLLLRILREFQAAPSFFDLLRYRAS
jgi:hypothetical protein